MSVMLGAAYSIALAQAWLWYAWTSNTVPPALLSNAAPDLISFALAIGWLVVFAVAIRNQGRWSLIALPSAPFALLPPLAFAALYGACYFDSNCL